MNTTRLGAAVWPLGITDVTAVTSLSKTSLGWARLAVLGMFLASTASALAQGALLNGALQSGSISTAGKSDSWTFTAPAGAAIMLRSGATNFTPRIRIFDPANVLAAEATSANGNVRDSFLTVQATNSGVYTVLVSAAFPTQTGTYSLSLAEAPGAISISPGDEGGALTNGVLNAGSLPLGDLDVWSFAAGAGDALMLRMGGTNLTPWLRLYGPAGEFVGEATSLNGNVRDSFLTRQATNSGTYTVVATAAFVGQSGTYSLSLAQVPAGISVSPGDQSGLLINGTLQTGSLLLGDLDVWSFAAHAGDALMLRMGGTNLTPWIRLYGPAAELVGEATSLNGNIRDSFLVTQATNSGTYTAVVSAAFVGQAGTYGLSLAQVPAAIVVAPGDEGGTLTNGVLNVGSLPLGDLDIWSFSANAGDALMLRMGATDLTPWIRLYGPAAELVGEATSLNGNIRDSFLTAQATNSGIYTVVVSAAFVGQAGTYALSLAHVPAAIVVSPGDDGGSLTNGVVNAGTLPVGDLDLWSFSANAGDSLMLRMGGTNLTPWIRLYGPAAELVAEATSANGNIRDTFLTTQATNSGIYTVVVNAAFVVQAGTYGLSLAQAPEPFLVSPGDQGGFLVNGLTNSASLALGDLDVWSFIGTPGDSNVLRVAATGFTPWIRLIGPSGTLLKEVKSSNGNIRSDALSQVITNAGTYTVVVSAAFSGQSGPYTIKESRVPPDLILPDTTTLAELTSMNVSISAQDPDEPAKPLQFALLSAPAGVTIALAGATNATLSWATTEADGPSTNVITATVTDVINGTAFVRTNSFTVIVQEINTAPSLTVPASTTINELTPLNVVASATDSDQPPNKLTYSLVAPPAGMVINPDTGAISWTPTEAQGPSVNVVSVVVTDDSPSAANAQHLSATNTFTVTVNEVNSAPVLPPQGNVTLDELKTLTVTNAATDGDIPINTLTYALVGAPANAIISPSGVISWTPSEAQGPSTNTFTTVVTDNGVPPLSATNSFIVVVNEVNTAPVLPAQGNLSIDELTSLTVTNTATDSDLPANTLSYALVGAPTNAVISATGLITWTPTEAQGPSTNTFTTIVTDNGVPSLSATNSFTVVVKEVNSAPVLPPQSKVSIDELTSLTVTNTATDSDLPANTLTYVLVGAPANAVISATGVISWTPNEAQGPSTNTFTTVVTDNGVPPLSATNTFIVVVNEVNTAPVLQGIPDRSLHFGDTLTIQAVASDSDLPQNQLIYSLDQGPSGLSINASTGLITWTPVQAQLGTYPVTVRVSDNGVPSLNATTTFQVTVTGQGSSLDIQRVGEGPSAPIQISVVADIGHDYELQESADLVTWSKLVQFSLTTKPSFTYIDPDSTSVAFRFYRVQFKSTP